MSNRPGAINIGSIRAYMMFCAREWVRFCRDSFADHSKEPLQVPWAKAVPLNISALQGTPLEAGDSLCYRGLILGWRGTQPSAPVYSFPFPSGNLGKIRSQFQSLKWRFLFHSSHTPVVTLAKSTQGEATSFIHICWVNTVVITKYFAFFSLIF